MVLRQSESTEFMASHFFSHKKNHQSTGQLVVSLVPRPLQVTSQYTFPVKTIDRKPCKSSAVMELSENEQSKESDNHQIGNRGTLVPSGHYQLAL